MMKMRMMKMRKKLKRKEKKFTILDVVEEFLVGQKGVILLSGML